MNDRAFRLDFFLAMGALILSVLTTATLIYQTRVIQQQYSATIWPYLSVNTTTDPNQGVREISLSNDGLGPALVRSAQLYVDGKAVNSWNDYGHVLRHDPLTKRAVRGAANGSTTADLSASTIVRPGESHTLLKVVLPKGVPIQLLLNHPIALDICYCSLNDNCWQMHTIAGQSGGTQRHAVGSCPIGPEIKSDIEVPT